MPFAIELLNSANQVVFKGTMPDFYVIPRNLKHQLVDGGPMHDFILLSDKVIPDRVEPYRYVVSIGEVYVVPLVARITPVPVTAWSPSY
jgi:hypothetical protein